MRRLCALFLFTLIPTVLHAQGIPQRVAELEARIAALEANLGPIDLTVDCAAAGSVNAALVQAAARPSAIIRIFGTCTETVAISRDDVTVVGMTAGAGITATSATATPLSIRGGVRVRLFNLTVDGGQTGMSVSGGASVSGNNVHVMNANIGIRASASTLELTNGSVTASGFHGLLATDASVTLRQSVVENNGGGGVFGWAGARITLEGGAVRNNTGGGVGLQGGAIAHLNNAVISGNGQSGISLFFGSTANVRGVTVENNQQSGINIAGGSSVVFGTSAIVRNNIGEGVNVSDTSVVGSFGGAVQITANTNGGIRCAASPAVAQITSGPGGFSLNASHVFGNAGFQINCPGIVF